MHQNYWQIEYTERAATPPVATLLLAVPQAQNVLSRAVIEDLERALTTLAEQELSGVIITSGKAGEFIAGADLREFSQLDSATDTLSLVQYANAVLHRIETLAVPSVARIDGHCLGGGLELALACDYRVVVARPSLRLGLPEVKLGIHPGFGGTPRLIATIGAPRAMSLILSGRVLPPRLARAYGVVDYCVPTRQLHATAEYLLQAPCAKRRAGPMLAALNVAPLRPVLAYYLERQLRARIARAHYPAPYAVIDYWRACGGKRGALFAAEQQSIAQLLTTPTCQNLVKVFFLQQQLKAAPPEQSADDLKFAQVHVIGAGTMGADIAAWCVLCGLTVTLQDHDHAALARATRRAYQLCAGKLHSTRLTTAAMDRLQPDLAGRGAAKADVIIEAVVENAEIKQQIFAQVERIARPEAILASNTSSIPLSEIAKGLTAPARLVGLHFFNPVAKMQLVEVVRGEHTNTHALATAFVRRIRRLPVVVKSQPGFLVNRILLPYLLEAMHMVCDGVAVSTIDRAATHFGMPMGPLQLADTVGLDICLGVGKNLQRADDQPVVDLLTGYVKQGRLGKKAKHGFYRWDKRRAIVPISDRIKSRSARSTRALTERLILSFINECVACLDEKIVASPELLDAAMVFGTGFAPFTAGPMHYLHQQSPTKLHARLTALHTQYGARFTPAIGWRALLNDDPVPAKSARAAASP